MRTVHIIFKTHLDIGFTDYADTVTRQYFEEYIPQVISLAKKVNTDEEKKFIWTTGSWLIYLYLKESNEENRQEMIAAIQRGDIVWHGLPFTTHTELMNRTLMEYGLNYSQQLDRQFNRQTIAAKMTDVPGHTQSLIPYLVENEIEFLHLGVNPASMPPDVPPIFIWEYHGKKIIVNYTFGAYGNEFSLDDESDVLVFCHSDDNVGPPSEEKINELFISLEKKYPNAKIVASTLDAYAKTLRDSTEQLPVISQEFGDTWIHGVGTDPKKVSNYRQLLHLLDGWIKDGKIDQTSEQYINFMDKLILVPEHTWGMDLKLHFRDYKNYLPDDFSNAYQKNTILDSSIPEKYNYISTFTEGHRLGQNRSYHHFEQSWEEQRAYLQEAIAFLPKALQQEYEIAISRHIELPETLDINHFDYQFGNYEVEIGFDGLLTSLLIDGNEYLKSSFGKLLYRQVGHQEYSNFFDTYIQNYERTYMWSVSDFSKPGLELIIPEVNSETMPMAVLGTKLVEHEDGFELFIETLCQKGKMLLEIPETVVHRYFFEKNNHTFTYEIQINGKKANRMPEEIWVQFDLQQRATFFAKKIGYEVDVNDVIKDGNKNLHAIETLESEGFTMTTEDAPLMAMYGPSVLKINRFTNDDQSFYGNLYNNIWGTNFPMWYGEDIYAKWKIEIHKIKE